MVDLVVGLEQQGSANRSDGNRSSHLPSEVNLLQQIVLQLLQAVEDKDQLLAPYNTNWHNCCAIATGRNGSVSTKTSYSCLPRRSLLPVSGRALHLQAKSRRHFPASSRVSIKRKKNQSAAGTAANVRGIAGSPPGGV